MDEFFEYLRGLPWKDWVAPIITGFFAIGGVWLTIASKRAEGDRVRRVAHDQSEHDRELKEEALDRNLEIAQTQDLTSRFKALMDGYEGRISDLSGELVSLRAELKEARGLLEGHQKICRGCPNYDKRFKDTNARSTST